MPGLLAGIAGELELVTRARIERRSIRAPGAHLAVPRADPLAAEDILPPPGASVLVRYRGAKPPISRKPTSDVVAFAVPGLSPENVAVVNAAAATLPPPARRRVRGPVVGFARNREKSSPRDGRRRGSELGVRGLFGRTLAAAPTAPTWPFHRRFEPRQERT